MVDFKNRTELWKKLSWLLASIIFALILPTCASQSASTPVGELALPTLFVSSTPVPSATHTLTPTITPTPTNSPTPGPTGTSTATPTITPTSTVGAGVVRAAPVDGAKIVYIPAGEFLMGSDPLLDPYFYGAEGPQHPIYLEAYWIYRTEVTNAMYADCVAASACPQPVRFDSNTRGEYYGIERYADYPVVYVSWRHAVAYCRWAGGRLPSEAEWEKAGRGEDGRLFPWGDEPPGPDSGQWGANDTAAVGSFPKGASPYGLLDMSGNVLEWVADYFQATYYRASTYENPLGPVSGSSRVYRGGSYHNAGAALRVVMRGSRSEDHANVDIGFRCVIDNGAP